MNFDLIIDVGPVVMAACILLSLFAGFIKGTVGFALPMILISGLATFLPAEVALAGMIIPSVVANTYQAFRNGALAARIAAGSTPPVGRYGIRTPRGGGLRLSPVCPGDGRSCRR